MKERMMIKEPYPKQREGFKLMLLSNANYFGTLIGSPLAPVFPMCCNTYYEELACVGYHPQQNKLEAVVYVYQGSGYGTGICGPGTSEYVRFYLSFDDGLNWIDQGMTSFQAYSISEGTEGEDKLEYAVTLEPDVPLRFCLQDLLVQVRAILSWNDPPPADQPDWTPVWGNVEERTIQIEPARVLPLMEFLQHTEVAIAPGIIDLIDPEMLVQTKAMAMDAVELQKHYAEKVPVHRFAHKEFTSIMSGKAAIDASIFGTLQEAIAFDPEWIVEFYQNPDGDTSYEELTCIGLDPNVPDTLVGVIHVKLPSGYSGGPCSDGSIEHVTFWADFNDNGTFESCLGTAQVRVYDLDDIPPEGVYYAVRLPVDLEAQRQPCEDGPRVVRIRAILSWNDPMSCGNPDDAPVWGNREETLIHIGPGYLEPAGKIAILGGVPVSMIDDVTGATTPDAKFALNNLQTDPNGLGRPCPFARRVTVQGLPLLGDSYLVEYRPASGGAWTPVVTDLTLTDEDGNTSSHAADPFTHRFDYKPFEQNIIGLLAIWPSAGDELSEVRLSTFNGPANAPFAPFISSDTHLLQLDNRSPEASIEITSGTGDCGKFPVGVTIEGKFVARDANFRSYSLTVEPTMMPPGAVSPAPASGTVQTVAAPGDDWDLDTHGMQPCGYIIRVHARDLAIVNSQTRGLHRWDSAGFCLGEPSEFDEPE